MSDSSLFEILDNITDVQPKAKVAGLPIEVQTSKAAHHIKAVRTASRLARLFTTERTTEVTASIEQHRETLADLGFRAPKTLRECNDLLTKLGE